MTQMPGRCQLAAAGNHQFSLLPWRQLLATTSSPCCRGGSCWQPPVLLVAVAAAAAAAGVKGDLDACCSWLPPPHLQLFVVLPLQDFSAVAERTGTYTAMDYADIMEHLNERWKIGERNDLTGEVSAAGGVAL
jgi:hypothetical protein